MIFNIPDLDVLKDVLSLERSGYYIAVPHYGKQRLFILRIPITQGITIIPNPGDNRYRLLTTQWGCDYVSINSTDTPINLLVTYGTGVTSGFKLRILNSEYSASCYFVRHIEDIASVVPVWMMWQVAAKTDFFRKIQEDNQ